MKGETHPYESSIFSANEAIQTEYPDFGKVILLNFKIIFSKKARKPGIDEVLGIWEGKLISDSTLSDVLLRFRYYMEQGELKCKYIFGGIMPGTSDVKFTEEMMLMFDLTGQLFHDEIRMVRKDFIVGRYCTMEIPILKLLKKAPGFIMKDNDRVCLPYILRKI